MSRGLLAALPLILILSVNGWPEDSVHRPPGRPMNGAAETDGFSIEPNAAVSPEDLARRVENLEIRIADLEWRIMEIDDAEAAMKRDMTATRARMTGGREIISSIFKALRREGGDLFPRYAPARSEAPEILRRRGFLKRVLAAAADISSEAGREMKRLETELEELRKEETDWRSMISKLLEEKEMIRMTGLKMEMLLAESGVNGADRKMSNPSENLSHGNGWTFDLTRYPFAPPMMQAAIRYQEIDTDFERMKGDLSWPVEGEVANPNHERGGAESGEGKRGIEIVVPPLSLIRPVHWGRVIYAGDLRGYGKLLIIDHGNHYYTLYSNMEELLAGVGEVVSPNGAIARVGVEGKPKRIYFGMRHHGEVMDPLDWLLPRR